jgi:hypothetical protein
VDDAAKGFTIIPFFFPCLRNFDTRAALILLHYGYEAWVRWTISAFDFRAVAGAYAGRYVITLVLSSETTAVLQRRRGNQCLGL